MNPSEPISYTVDSTKDWSLDDILKSSPNFKPVQRVHYSSVEKDPARLQVESNPIPIVIEGWHEHPSWSQNFTLQTFIEQSPAEISVRNVRTWSDHHIKLHTFIEKCRSTPTYVVANETERLYGKDVETPQEWIEWLKFGKVIPEAIAPEGPTDLLRFRPRNDGIHTLMCYLGIGDTFTPCHKDLCASTGHNLMAYAENGGSSFWFMVDGGLAGDVADYFHKLGQEIDHENHVVTLAQWAKAPFNVYILEQKLGDLVLVPPRSCHQVVNYGGLTLKMSWSRLTSKGMSIGYYHELPLYRRVCRKETYRMKGTLYYAIDGLVKELSVAQRHSKCVQDLARLKTLKELMAIYDSVLIEDKPPTDITPRCDALAIETSPEFPCDFCGTDIFQSFFECDKCAHGPDNAPYTICAWCYVEGRSCLCQVMAPKEVRPYNHLLALREQAIAVVKRVGGTPYDPINLEPTTHTDTVFNSACILHAMVKKEKATLGLLNSAAKPKAQRQCLVDRLRASFKPHPTLLSAFMICRPCHFGLCFEHTLAVYRIHSLEALSLLSTDQTLRSYHERHKQTRAQPYDRELDKIRQYQSSGVPPPLHTQLSHIASNFKDGRPHVPDKSTVGFYDYSSQILPLVASVTDEEVPETVAESSSDIDLFSLASSPLSSPSEDAAPSKKYYPDTEVLPRGVVAPKNLAFVSVPRAPYRLPPGWIFRAELHQGLRPPGPTESPPTALSYDSVQIKIGPPRSQRKGKRRGKDRVDSLGDDSSALATSSNPEGVAVNSLELGLVKAYSLVHEKPRKGKLPLPNGPSTSRKPEPKVVPTKRPAPEPLKPTLGNKRRALLPTVAAGKPKGSSTIPGTPSFLLKRPTKRKIVDSSPSPSPPPSKVAKQGVVSSRAPLPSLSSSSSSSLPVPNDKTNPSPPLSSSVSRSPQVPIPTNSIPISNNKSNPPNVRSSARPVPPVPPAATVGSSAQSGPAQPSHSKPKSLVPPTEPVFSLPPGLTITPLSSRTPTFARTLATSAPLSSLKIPKNIAPPVASQEVSCPVTQTPPVPPQVPSPTAGQASSSTQERPPEVHAPAPVPVTSGVLERSPPDVPVGMEIPVYHEDRRSSQLAVDDWVPDNDGASATHAPEGTPTNEPTNSPEFAPPPYAHRFQQSGQGNLQQQLLHDASFMDAVATRVSEILLARNSFGVPQTTIGPQFLNQPSSSGGPNQPPFYQPFPVASYFGAPNFMGPPPGPNPAWGNGFYHSGPVMQMQGWGTGYPAAPNMQNAPNNAPHGGGVAQEADPPRPHEATGTTPPKRDNNAFGRSGHKRAESGRDGRHTTPTRLDRWEVPPHRESRSKPSRDIAWSATPEPPTHSRSQPNHHRRSRSRSRPRPRSRSRTPRRRSRSRARRTLPPSRDLPPRARSYSPHSRARSYSPHTRTRSYSPSTRTRSYSPRPRTRSYSPRPRSRSRSRTPLSRSRSPVRGRSRTRSPSRGPRPGTPPRSPSPSASPLVSTHTPTPAPPIFTNTGSGRPNYRGRGGNFTPRGGFQIRGRGSRPFRARGHWRHNHGQHQANGSRWDQTRNDVSNDYPAPTNTSNEWCGTGWNDEPGGGGWNTGKF